MNYLLNHDGKKYRKFFEEIAAIPHESYKEKDLSDYIVKFADDRGLWWHQDQVWNVIIKKPASQGFEDHEPVMLQGHLDMVCVKTPESTHDFELDPLQLYVEDGFLKAKNTTLGADCGHGISYMLAILDDLTLKHPPLECLFTVQEEVGVGGPKHLDYTLLSARRLIFTDSMGEGSPELSTTSVLGGNYRKYIKKEELGRTEKRCKGDFYQVTAGGLAGGHAAVDINKGRGNAIKILARAAYNFLKITDIQICSFQGGTLKNNIPDHGEMIFYTENKADFAAVVAEIEEAVRLEHGETDPAPFVTIKKAEAMSAALTTENTREIIEWILLIPTGTYFTSPQEPSFPMTSRNLGTAQLNDDHISLGYMYRSSVSSHIGMLFDQQEILCRMFRAEWEKEYDYPGYRIEAGSLMYRTYEKVYQELTENTLTPIHIHAGTDVGTIIERMGAMDIIGIGPNTYRFHTPDEALDLASYDRAYQYIIKVLERL